MSMKKQMRSRCFFDVQVGDDQVGRIVFELYNDMCPLTCENFKCLCTGECGIGKTTGMSLHYQNVAFHRIVKNFMIQGGDFSMGNGRGGESIYGGTFKDENFTIKFDQPFLLAMANRGKDTNGSQFFITTKATPHLNGVHVVFGHVISGQEFISQIEQEPTDESNKPLVQVLISNCGELIPQVKPKDKKKKKHKEKSDSESKKEKTKQKKHKKHKNKNNEKTEDEEIKDEGEKDAECSVRPEEIPQIPVNTFLQRVSRNPSAERTTKEPDQRDQKKSSNTSARGYRSSSGRIIRGRGHCAYRTPSPNTINSGINTPPHWKTDREKFNKNHIDDQRRIDNREWRPKDEYERNRHRYRDRDGRQYDQHYEGTRHDGYSHRERRRFMEKGRESDEYLKERNKRRRFTEEPPHKQHQDDHHKDIHSYERSTQQRNETEKRESTFDENRKAASNQGTGDSIINSAIILDIHVTPEKTKSSKQAADATNCEIQDSKVVDKEVASSRRQTVEKTESKKNGIGRVESSESSGKNEKVSKSRISKKDATKSKKRQKRATSSSSSSSSASSSSSSGSTNSSESSTRKKTKKTKKSKSKH